MKKQATKIREIISFLEKTAPLKTQESYDNSGLITGDADRVCNSVLICLDVTEEVIDEAIRINTDLIISHHPFIFGSIKKVSAKTENGRILIKAIRNNIAVFALHTPYDAAIGGINFALAEKLGLVNIKVLKPAAGQLRKIVTFVPSAHAEKVREAMFAAGSGNIGNYDSCSYNLNGEGTFRALEGSNPFTGKKGKVHSEKETRVETIVPFYKVDAVISAMKNAHPYEEVAYDIYPLENTNPYNGFGTTGELKKTVSEKDFLGFVKVQIGCKMIRHSQLLGKPVKKVALCGGSGGFLIADAIHSGADIFITGDIKYHQFFEAEKRIVITDIGHFESEKVFLSKMKEQLMKNFTNFAIRISKTNTNPVNYF